MKSPWPRFRISSRTIRQSVAAAGVIASLAFVGLQIRQSNIQARAAAYQAIGIATSGDWERWERLLSADLRMLETVLLQVDQGLLPQNAITRLGYNWGPILSNWLRVPLA